MRVVLSRLFFLFRPVRLSLALVPALGLALHAPPVWAADSGGKLGDNIL